MNSITERWIPAYRHELLDQTPILNQAHLLHTLRGRTPPNEHRPHQGILNARPPAALPKPIINGDQLAHLNIHRRDRLDGTHH
jgi:hypothetical protein